MLNDEKEWCVVTDKFASRWSLPNTIRAIDGKHIMLKPLLSQAQCTTTTRGSEASSSWLWSKKSAITDQMLHIDWSRQQKMCMDQNNFNSQ